MNDTSGSDNISTKVQRIAQLAREDPERSLWNLAHHIDIEWLREAYRRTRKDGATGTDGQTAESYAENLEDNLRDLLERAKSGRYLAPPVRRVHIPKGDGSKTRPIGIPSFEDKVLQRAVVMVLEAIYEEDFMPFSYGFRPGRSAHHTLEATRNHLKEMDGGWVLELDIQGYFDTLDHAHLRGFLKQRMLDGVLNRLIGKWMNAGVMEKGMLAYPEAGSPQGGVVSPILSNLYLHEVFDKWFAREVKPRLKGRAEATRYADDIVVIFEREEDARRVLEVLPKRFGKYNLTLHPEKTRLIDFRRPHGGRPAGWTPGSFELLGFTHHWGKSRKGSQIVKQKTAKGRFSRALKTVGHWCRMNRHLPIAEQHRILCLKLRGHNGYYGITGNSLALTRFKWEVERRWKKWLGRRSQKGKRDWGWFIRLLERYPLPPPIAIHSIYRQAANPSR